MGSLRHPSLRHLSGETPGHRWQAVFAAPDPRLGSFIVGDYQGWQEYSADRIFRPQMPIVMIPLILNLGPRWEIGAPEVAWGEAKPFDSFLAGLHDGIATTLSGGDAECLQINLTPLGAHLLLRQPMSPLANRTLDLDDLLGREVGDLVAQLHEARDWPARFELIDSFLLARLSDCRADGEVAHSLQRLEASHGRVSIGDLAEDLGWSRKRLISRFQAELGLPPKMIARILRFNRMLALIDDRRGRGLAELADIAGYYDQAHFYRDFRDFARTTPGEYLSGRPSHMPSH